jgi:hypothetical protein
MRYLSVLKKIVATLALSGFMSSALAQWELNGGLSDIEFISVKNAAVAESHSFSSVTGSVTAGGALSLEIALDSVETLIPIRNERMRKLLFETANFPLALVTAEVDEAVIKTAAGGGVLVTEIPINLELHGHEKAMMVPVVLAGTAGGGLLVVTTSPILVNAADFGLDVGIGLLQSAAGLDSIVTAVPVSFQLLFVPTP